jgi:hypothetical protein
MAVIVSLLFLAFLGATLAEVAPLFYFLEFKNRIEPN